MAHTYLKGHTWKRRIRDVEKFIRKIEHAHRINSVMLLRCGCMLHYLEDFFTFPHNQAYTGSLKEHVHYETQLYEYLISENGNMEKNSVQRIRSSEEMIEQLHQLHEAYENCEYGFANDVSYITEIASRAVGYIGCMMEKQDRISLSYTPAYERRILFPYKAYRL